MEKWPERWNNISEEDSQYEIARLVARWILMGKPNVEKQETQNWLIENGYGHLIGDVKEKDNGRV